MEDRIVAADPSAHGLHYAGVSVAVITGGASGFGLALGRRCAALGMRVALLDRDGERAATEAAALDGFGLGVDVADAGAVDAAASAVSERFGGADLVISNVGVQLFGSLESFTDDEWRWVLDVNVAGSARVARAFLPLLRTSNDAHLAFTTSSSVFDPAAHLGAYQASKFAVWGLAETLRLELAPDGIGVTVVFPSGMVSRHLETSQQAQPAAIARPVAQPEDFQAMFASNPTMSTMLATPEEAAEGVVEAILAGERYVITHGDLRAPLRARHAVLEQSAEL